MQAIDEMPTGLEDANPPNDLPAPLEEDRGIEFPVDALPYSILGSPISEFRSGTIHIKNGTLKFDGRDTVPDYLRAKLYALGSILFLPGLALAYLLIEQVSWISSSFTISDESFLAYTTKDEYSIVALLYNPSGSGTSSARRTLTFQLPTGQYLRVKSELERTFPGKRSNSMLKAGAASGSSSATLGIIIWIAAIVGTVLWRPW